MAAKITAKQIQKAAEEAGIVGEKAVKEFASEFEKLMARVYKPKAPKPAASMPAQANKPAPPPSQPRPQLQQEKPPSPEFEFKTKPQPKALPLPAGEAPTLKKKRKGETEKNPGLVKIADVVEIVDKVFEGKGALMELLSMITLVSDSRPQEMAIRKRLGQAVSENEAIAAMSKPDQIKALVKKKRLAWRNPRSREKLDTPGRYPNGVKKADIMRRGTSDKVKAEVGGFVMTPISAGGFLGLQQNQQGDGNRYDLFPV